MRAIVLMPNIVGKLARPLGVTLSFAACLASLLASLFPIMPQCLGN
jgi:multidrug efflux pump subunit AcrB